MNDAKTLVILTPGFPADESDTTCLPARQTFVRIIKKHYPELEIIVLSFQYPFFAKTYNWYGVRVIPFNGRNKGKLNRLMVWLSVWRTLKELNKEKNIIGVLSFWLGECAFVGNYFSKKNKIRHYTWILGQDAAKGNKYFRLVKPASESLIALSDFIAAEFYKNYGAQPKHVIPVGIEPSLFKLQSPGRTIDVLGAGSLIPLKQYNVFIDVVKSLTGFFPGLKAVICGKGIEKPKLLRQIEALGLEKNITLLDELPHPEVLDLMQQAKVFLHTSAYEGFGSVCAEALYAGAHVISFCKPMKPDIHHWHIVQTRLEMVTCSKEILLNNFIDHDPVLAYSAGETARLVRELFVN